MSKKILLYALFILGLKPALAQETTSPDSIKKAKYDYLILSTKAQNAFTFLGRDFGQNIPLLSNDLMYFFNSGIYLNASAVKFFQEGVPFQYSLTAGFIKDLGKNLELNMSYSRFMVSGNSEVTGIQNLSFLQGGLGLDWGLLNSTVQGQLLFNEKTDYFISSTHSRYFEVDQYLWNTIKFSFEPKLTVLAGTSDYYRMGAYGLEQEELTALGKFQLQSIEFGIPLVFSIGFLDIEWQSRFVQPLNVPAFDNSSSRFIHSLQLSYLIPVKK